MNDFHAFCMENIFQKRNIKKLPTYDPKKILRRFRQQDIYFFALHEIINSTFKWPFIMDKTLSALHYGKYLCHFHIL